MQIKNTIKDIIELLENNFDKIIDLFSLVDNSNEDTIHNWEETIKGRGGVYLFRDPKDNSIVYVGSTGLGEKWDFVKRRRQHLSIRVGGQERDKLIKSIKQIINESSFKSQNNKLKKLSISEKTNINSIKKYIGHNKFDSVLLDLFEVSFRIDNSATLTNNIRANNPRLSIKDTLEKAQTFKMFTLCIDNPSLTQAIERILIYCARPKYNIR
nr:hypothetical protein [uncultured Dethiosulfovibrio sp.]